MPNIKIGDVVVRKSYGYDTVFKVASVQEVHNGEKMLTLKGIDFRIEADSPESDLKVVSDKEIDKLRVKNNQINKVISKTKGTGNFFRRGLQREGQTFVKPGKILHIDGAKDYLDKCKEYYIGIGTEAVVIDVAEKDQPLKVHELLQQYKPDILVLTGHDGMIKGNTEFNNIQNYRNSLYFVNATKEARTYNSSLDDLVIYAGACQSNYEAILAAGANYASSPKRVFIHMFDPVVVAGKVSLAEIGRVLPIKEVVADTNTGFEGVGGLETWGRARVGAPKGN
ncbi:MAG: sporulation peptidase YabG [Deltaproteobacteria bacterium]